MKHLDCWYISFNKKYVLRVHFNTNLDKGDKIAIYARWNTVPSIKNATIYIPNGTMVGSGEVLPQWGWYYLLITSDITPTDVFDIVIDGGNPSSHQMKVNKVKCIEEEPEPPVEAWRDPVTGMIVVNYQVNFNYLVTVEGNIDPSEVYIDLEIFQNITDDNDGNSTIVNGLLEKETIHVTSINVSQHYSSTPVAIIDHGVAGTDNITIHVDVDVTAYGLIDGTNDWIAINKTYNHLQEIEVAWW